MGTRFILSLMLLGFGGGSLHAADKEALCGALRMPLVRATATSLSIRDIIDFYSRREKPETRRMIAELEKNLQGDPRDAETHARIAELHFALDATDKGEMADARAAEHFRARLALSPNDAVLMARLAACLPEAGTAEAQKLLERAVELAPDNPECWLKLGEFRNWRAVTAVIGPGRKTVQFDFAKEWWQERDRKNDEPSLQAVCDSLLCFDKAVALEPKNAKTVAQRMGCRMWLGTARLKVGNNPPDVTAFYKVFCDPGIRADVWTITRLDPENYPALVAAVTLEMVNARLRDSPTAIQVLGIAGAPSDDIARDVKAALERLGTLSAGEKMPAAVECSAKLGVLMMGYLNQPNLAEFFLRRALELDPQHEEAFETLLSVLIGSGRLQPAVEVVKKRLTVQNSARTRLDLAKLYFRLDDLVVAENELRAALKLDPKDWLVLHGLAVLRLKQEFSAARLAEAKEFMRQALIHRPKDIGPEYEADYDATRAVLLALDGDEAGAKALLTKVLGVVPDQQVALAAFQCLK